ncbi:MAG: hypothetical protein ACRDD1_11705, partial [Planctomycetia bacterium]
LLLRHGEDSLRRWTLAVVVATAAGRDSCRRDQTSFSRRVTYTISEVRRGANGVKRRLGIAQGQAE